MTPVVSLRGAIDAEACIRQAWELVKRRPLLYIGSVLVMIVITQVIPYIGFLLVGPMVGGFAGIVLRDMRNEPVDFSTLFRGFDKFFPLLLIGLMQAIPALTIAGIALVANSAGIMWRTGDVPYPQVFTAGFVLMLIGYVAFTFIWSGVLIFAIPLYVEHDISLGETIKLSFGALFRNFGGFFALAFLNGLVAILGLLALVIGIVVAMPVIYAAQVFAYKQVFPSTEPVPEPTPGGYVSIFDVES